MQDVRRERERKQLEHELQEEGYVEMLARLKASEPFMHKFTRWAEVLDFMQHGTSLDPQKNVVLLAIFRASIVSKLSEVVESLAMSAREPNNSPKTRLQAAEHLRLFAEAAVYLGPTGRLLARAKAIRSRNIKTGRKRMNSHATP